MDNHITKQKQVKRIRNSRNGIDDPLLVYIWGDRLLGRYPPEKNALIQADIGTFLGEGSLYDLGKIKKTRRIDKKAKGKSKKNISSCLLNGVYLTINPG